MSENKTLNIEIRQDSGKGAARALRRDGKIPAIIYGTKGETKISLSSRDMFVEWSKGGFLSKLLELTDGKKTFKVLPREVQLHPVKDTPLHADFLQVEDSTEIIVKVAVKFINREKSPGIKLGGILSVVRHKIELKCKASVIPEQLVVDLGGSKIGDSIHISAIELPVGVRPTIERDFTIATIAGRGTSQSDADEDESSDGEEETEDAAE